MLTEHYKVQAVFDKEIGRFIRLLWNIGMGCLRPQPCHPQCSSLRNSLSMVRNLYCAISVSITYIWLRLDCNPRLLRILYPRTSYSVFVCMKFAAAVAINNISGHVLKHPGKFSQPFQYIIWKPGSTPKPGYETVPSQQPPYPLLGKFTFQTIWSWLELIEYSSPSCATKIKLKLNLELTPTYKATYAAWYESLQSFLAVAPTFWGFHQHQLLMIWTCDVDLTHHNFS